jgi:hypothetical protein
LGQKAAAITGTHRSTTRAEADDLRSYLTIIVFSAATLAGALSLSDAAWASYCLSKLAYYPLLLLVVWWCVLLADRLRESRPLAPRLRKHAGGIAFGAVLGGLLITSAGPQFRVLADETNLLSVSRSMLFERTTDNVTMGMFAYRNFQPLVDKQPKRPLLFPFATHLVHAALGVRAANPLILNGALLIAMLILLSIVAARAGPPAAAFLVPLLVAAQPVIIQMASSGGFDTLALFVALLAALALRDYLAQPSQGRFEWLLAQLLLLSHTRHESIVIPAIVLGGLAIARRLPWGLLRNSPLAAVAPLLLLPRIWLEVSRHARDTPFENLSGQAAFAAGHVWEHTLGFATTLYRFDFVLPYATLVNLLGLVGIGALLLRLGRERERDADATLFARIVLACTLALWIILTAFHLGDPQLPSSARFFAPFSLLLSLFAARALLGSPIAVQSPRVAIAIGALLLALYHPQTVENRFMNGLTAARRYHGVIEALRSLDRTDLLVITDRPGQMTVNDFGAVQFGYANEYRGILLRHLERDAIGEILVVQELPYSGGPPEPRFRLHPDYALEPVHSFELRPETRVRISRVVH